jgi:hypothetical protein
MQLQSTEQDTSAPEADENAGLDGAVVPTERIAAKGGPRQAEDVMQEDGTAAS